MNRYAIGVDLGIAAGRAAFVAVAGDTRLAASVHPYSNGVIDGWLPLAGRSVARRNP